MIWNSIWLNVGVIFAVCFGSCLYNLLKGQGVEALYRKEFYIANQEMLYLALFISLVLSLMWNSIYIQMQYKQLHERQLLARMILENQWFEKTKVKQEGFFNDSPGKTVDKISYFPKICYKRTNKEIRISCKLTMGRYLDKLLTLESKVESGLFCSMIKKEFNEPYVEYLFLTDMSSCRIKMDEVSANGGSIRLMSCMTWKYEKYPHGLIAGGTGSGKTYFMLILLNALIAAGYDVRVLDPKKADLSGFKGVLPFVGSEPEEIKDGIAAFIGDMFLRNEEMKRLPNYAIGKNYRELGLKPKFLLFDEYVAFLEMLPKKELEEVLGSLKQIAFLGRQSGFFLILGCQRADAKYMADGMRDQFHLKVALGQNSDSGYKMLFGSDSDKTYQTMKPGTGYATVGDGQVLEFYAPLVPEDTDFLREVELAYNSNLESLQPEEKAASL